MSNSKQIFRQGDVLIMACSAPTGDLEPVAPEGGLLILARGEATGHHHSISDLSHASLLAKGAQRFLRIAEPVSLRHQEHDPVRLPAGNFEVVIQREYTPEHIRLVQD